MKESSSTFIELHDSFECGNSIKATSPFHAPHFPSPSSIKQSAGKQGGGPESSRNQEFQQICADLCRFARFGLNIADAHSCFIFLPGDVFIKLSGDLTASPAAEGETLSGSRYLTLVGVHSLSNEVVQPCTVPTGSGLIGWVAAHHRSIHVSPFELDSRTLGIYSTDQNLKSFLGIPIPLGPSLFPVVAGTTPRGAKPNAGQASGVIACDSKKSFAFSKLQGKLLEELATEVANCLQLHVRCQDAQLVDISWNGFLRRCDELTTALGTASIELLRLRFINFEALERASGLGPVLNLADQVLRLFKQSLPPHFPLIRIHNGDILVCLDSMMSSFFENKFKAICDHIAAPGKRPELGITRASFRDKRRKVSTIEGLVALTADAVEGERGSGLGQVFHLTKGIVNGFGRS